MVTVHITNHKEGRAPTEGIWVPNLTQVRIAEEILKYKGLENTKFE